MAGLPYSSGVIFPSSSGFSSSPPSNYVSGPCAACKMLRRRCTDTCVLVPYFPKNDPLKFAIVHKVFGASNVTKILQELPEEQRADAVSSMVYEANARIEDPVYGCTGAIFRLQKQITELQVEVAKAKAEVFNMQCQNDNLVSMISMGISQNQELNISHELQYPPDNSNWFFHD